MNFNGMERMGRKVVATALLAGASVAASAQEHTQEKIPVKTEHVAENKHTKVTPEVIAAAEEVEESEEIFQELFGEHQVVEKLPCDFPERDVVTDPAKLKALLDTGFVIEDKDTAIHLSESKEERAARLAKKYSEAYAKIDAQVQWLDSVMSTQEYKFKLTVNEKVSLEEYAKRRERVKNSKDHFLVLDNLQNRLFKGSDRFKNLKGHPVGYSDASTGMIYLDISGKEETIPLHEVEHHATKSNLRLSKFAEDLYRESFIPSSDTLTLEQILYLKKPTERDARRKQLEYDMDRLNVKKYEDPFTHECFDKVMKLKEEGRLSPGSVEFLETTKPEFLERIFNHIAFQEAENSGDSATAQTA